MSFFNKLPSFSVTVPLSAVIRLARLARGCFQGDLSAREAARQALQFAVPQDQAASLWTTPRRSEKDLPTAMALIRGRGANLPAEFPCHRAN